MSDEQHPLTLDYYLSFPVNAFSEDNSFSQEDANEQAEIEFKQDCIIKTVGTRECKFNIDCFWNEIFDAFLDEDQERNFLSRLVNKLINVYELDILKQYTIDYYDLTIFRKEIFRILIFFESTYCCDIIADIYYSKNLVIIVDDIEQLKQYLNMYYDLAFQKMLKVKDQLSPWIYYCFAMMPKDDFINLVVRLVERYKNEFLTKVLTIREGTNVKN